jgi:hypothetical protein
MLFLHKKVLAWRLVLLTPAAGIRMCLRMMVWLTCWNSRSSEVRMEGSTPNVSRGMNTTVSPSPDSAERDRISDGQTWLIDIL